MKFDYEGELPTGHHWVYPSGAMTDIQEELSCPYPARLSPAPMARGKGGQGAMPTDSGCQSRLHRDKPGGGHIISFTGIGL